MSLLLTTIGYVRWRNSEAIPSPWFSERHARPTQYYPGNSHKLRAGQAPNETGIHPLTDFPDYAQTNRAHWNRQADWWVASGRRNWNSDEVHWGNWGIPNAQLPLLPEVMSGLDAIELGCGTAYVSAWMTRRGARCVGVDPSDGQLATARSFIAHYGLEIELIHGVAEDVPKPDESFDFAFSEYGAAIWADPYVWIPEAWRLLRPNGRLHFLGSSTLSMVCASHDDGPTSTTMQRDYFGLHRVEWTRPEDPSIEFNLPISEWFALFRQTGFVIEDFYEVQAPADAMGEQFGISADWAQRYPLEQAWRLRKPGSGRTAADEGLKV